MIAFAYLIPVIGCLLLHFEFEYSGEWTTYLWIALTGEAFTGLLHWLFYRSTVSCREYLGSIVAGIYHEEPWTEIVKRTETRRDSNGRTYTVTTTNYIYHSEIYYFQTSLGSTKSCDSESYYDIETLWGLRPQRLSWSGPHIKGGARFGSAVEFNDLKDADRNNPRYWVPITETGRYRNKIRCSNSIFKFEKIGRKQARELGLYDYPGIDGYDAPCILSDPFSIPEDVDDMFRKFNARYGEEMQIRLYILLFDSSRNIAISELQRAYWQGGNKNEFTVCISFDNEARVKWARAFSWADEQTVEVETAQWLMNQPKFDWMQFYNFLESHLAGWKRKEFKDFNYISINLPFWKMLSIFVLSAVEMAAVIYMVLSM